MVEMKGKMYNQQFLQQAGNKQKGKVDYKKVEVHVHTIEANSTPFHHNAKT
jgi:hypothetical protein